MSFSAQSDLNFQYAISQIWLLPIMEAGEMQILGLGQARASNKGQTKFREDHIEGPKDVDPMVSRCEIGKPMQRS